MSVKFLGDMAKMLSGSLFASFLAGLLFLSVGFALRFQFCGQYFLLLQCSFLLFLFEVVGVITAINNQFAITKFHDPIGNARNEIAVMGYH